MKYQLDKSQIDDTPCAALYRSNTECFPPAIIGCFVMNDGWSEQALFELKQKVKADILVGLQTDDYNHEGFDIVEAVIKCQPDKVNDVVELLNVRSASTIIGIDVIDVIHLLECGNSFQFVHTSAKGEPESDMVKSATHKLISQISSIGNIRGLFVNPESSESLALEDFSYISEAIESVYDGTEVYYSQSITNELNSFCLRAIYAEG
tara:strand:+ start:2284 stop:2904 length:621 start_codon:yes stop_codon:yes gene_type:complete